MKAILKYEVVQTIGDYQKFVQDVNEAIKEGWQPLGGMTTTMASTYSSEIFYQSIVKYAPEREE